MNVIKFLRRPYLAILLASLTLFASCSQYDNEFEGNYQNVDLETFVSKHLETSSKIAILLEKEKNIDFNQITEITNKNITLKELRSKYEALGLKEFNELAHLVIGLLNNSNNFVKSNSNLNKSEIDNLITTEINNQLDEPSSLFNRSSSCQSTYESSMSRCHRNWAITTAISAVGMFMGGVAGALGVLVAGVLLAECESSAFSTLQDCNQ